MSKQKIEASKSAAINKCTFQKPGYIFDHWEVESPSPLLTYADEEVIPANKYAIGDKLTLNAKFVRDVKHATLVNNEFTLTLHGGETANIEDLPSGTAYQVYEETPDGWILIYQSNISGEINSLETSTSKFLNQKYDGAVTVQFIGTKTLDGKAAADRAFRFQLLEGETVLQTVYNKSGGLIQFDALQYTEAGQHIYTIKEITGSDRTIDYDSHVEQIQVDIANGQSGNLTSTVTYISHDNDNDGQIAFRNRTIPGSLEITKTAENLSDANRDTTFRFEVTFQNEDGTLVEGNNIYWYVKDAA